MRQLSPQLDPTPAIQIDEARRIVQGGVTEEPFYRIVDLSGEAIRLEHAVHGAEDAGVII